MGIQASKSDKIQSEWNNARLYIQAQPWPVWSIVLQGITSAFVTSLAILLVIALFTFFIDSEQLVKGEILFGSLTFFGVACWSWYTTYSMYFLRRHYAEVFIAVTDGEFVYQYFDAFLRLKRLRIPKRDILKVEHGQIYPVMEEMSDWQIYIRYLDQRGKKRKLWIKFEEFFSLREGMRLIEALRKG